MPTDYPSPLPATVFVLDGDPQPEGYIDGPKWTQDEAIAYECARECITALMAVCTDELHHSNPDPERRAVIVAERSRLAAELRGLHVHDHAEIARIRTEYGALIRAGWTPGRAG